VPSLLLKMVMGEMAKVITEGSRVSCQKLLEDGFEFQHPKLKPALIDLLK
jgi:NAD dependent epimerase/dehydratase family enzyme